MKVWTEAYSPFIMGGDVSAPIGTDVEAGKPIPVGQDAAVCLVVSPKGKKFYAETTTGAFVGTSLRMVRYDMKQADPAIVKQQLKDAAKRVKLVRWVSPQEFWARLRQKPSVPGE